MSFDALAWAGKCQPGNPARKLVLIALADRHNAESDLAYPSVPWLAEWTGLNRKTVIAALDTLEAQGLISDSGERVGKTKQIKAYRLHLGTVPKTEQSQKRNSPTFSAKESQKRDTEPVREPVSGKAKASPDKRGGKTIIPADWKLPPASELPPQAKLCAEQWTGASYLTHGEAFHSYWRSTRRMMADWRATWANRVIALHSQVMRDQKYGNAPTEMVKPADRTPEWYLEQAAFFEKIGQDDNANEYRRLARGSPVIA